MAAYNTIQEVKSQPNGGLFFYPDEIVLREEQQDAVRKAKNMFGSVPKGGTYTVHADYRQFLWNAKMRFGKTLCALQLVKEMNVKRILIVTHRPVVSEEWFDNYKKLHMEDSGYAYGTKSDRDEHGNYYDLELFVQQPDKHYIFFASMQYLRRSTLVGGDNDEQLKKDLLSTDWDMVVVDEAHEGTRTALGQRVIDLLKKAKTKMLHLSGTPFNLYEDFKEKEIYTWDYIQEQQAKRDWPKNHPNEPNPYEDLPQMKIFTYDLGKLLDGFIEEGASFKFTEFYRTWTGNPKADKANMPEGKKGRFVHEEAVRQFLDKLCEDSATSNYPFSTDNYKNTFNHTLWIVPGVKEAKALEQLLREHDIFGSFDAIINVAGNGSEDEEREDALDKVKNAIGAQPDETYTITISCGRLTTGVTIKPWTAVFYMKGSEMTSAATYMQSIFRVQSPWVIKDEKGKPVKMKRECYVFDFAPDRSLKMVAETAKFSSQAKKANKKKADGEELTQEERDKETMEEFLKLCPVVSLDGGAMLEYDANKLFRQLETVYIDRLVTSGFNDLCLYNADELMRMDAAELNALGAKIAKTSNMDKPKNATPSDSILITHLSEEERQKLEEAKRKARENRKEKRDPYEGLTDEEIKAIEAEKERRKKEREERDKRITNIRGISLRIPLLMYGGADAGDPNEDLTVDNFTRKIKDESWEEFMPRGITKKDFNTIKRCYNATRFEEAGKRYRALAREADEMHVEDRIRRIADIFACFHNPDKETVLTPWNVVNMHLSKSIGGWCFFDSTFDKKLGGLNTPQHTNIKEITKEIFEKVDRASGSHLSNILEINSKTGLYPLYMVYSMYRALLKVYIEENAIEAPDNISISEEQAIWDEVVANNIYVICNTTMAEHITRRTLLGFRENTKDNIRSMNMIKDAITNKKELIENILSVGKWKGNNSKKKMEFQATVGNPPYMIKKEGTSDKPIYHLFMEIGINVANIATFITPGRFLFNAGKTPEDFNQRMLNDEHFRVVWYEPNPKKIFENVDVMGGIAVTLHDKKRIFGKIHTFTAHHELSTILHKVVERSDFKSIDNLIVLQSKFNLNELYSQYPEYKKKIGSNGRERRLTTSIFSQLDVFKIERQNKDEIGIIGLIDNIRHYRYISRSLIDESTNLNKYKVILPKSNGSGALGEVASTPLIGEPLIGEPLIGYTQSFIGIGSFETKVEAEACLKYVKTKFMRTMLGILKVTQDNNIDVWAYVPLQDFTPNSDIDWRMSVSDIDNYLYTKYGLDNDEIQFIEDHVSHME